MIVFLSLLQKRVMNIHLGHDGLTDEEMLALYKVKHSGMNAVAEPTPRIRRRELTRMGLLVDSGKKRPMRSGNLATVWITSRGMR